MTDLGWPRLARGTRAGHLRPLAVVGLTLAVLVTGCAGNQSMFNPQGPAARNIAMLGWFLLTVCAVVYVLVMAVTAWALLRRRHVADGPPPASGRLTGTVAWAIGATVLILSAFTVSSVFAGRGLTSPSGPGAITIDVIGHQWWWEFRYHSATPSNVVTSPNELHIPVGVPVHLRAQSRDVIHSFWVPNLHGKRDLVPGQVTTTWLQADAPGEYRGQCAEFCGQQHANMAFVVVAEPMDRFEQWLAHQRQPAAEPDTPDAIRGRDLFMQSTCAMCHTVRGTSAASRIGPELTHVASRRTIAAGTLPNTRQHVGEWVADPQAIRPGVRMPPSVLSPVDLEAVAAYLRSLR